MVRRPRQPGGIPMRRLQTAASALVAAATAALVLTAGVAPASADTEVVTEAYIDASGVVHYPFDPAALPGASIVTQNGLTSRVGDCSFNATGSDSASEGPTLTVGQEVTFDPATCTRELALVTYPLSDVPAVVSATLEPEDGWVQEEATASSGEVSGRATTWFASLNARVQDPVGIHVSSTTTERTWSSTGTWNNVHRWGWYTPTGWSRLSNSQVDTSTVGDTLGTFRNVAFCNPFAATDTNHSRTRLQTSSASGGVTWGYTMNKSGDCSELLSYHYSLITP
ncbi:hypothetical protein QT381_15460 [Galbitalea sp. SE-J8]|uniref:hypothetical protein n=1 Tax=Galbitalea sp. SE-J8 TaxID=3054952 RepID=UPI00259CB7E7|nr:hypothetical protein [Galbitalea sp. SE-J8]MDM4764397.1 hypothetical protein [Galbitalea sp. SE-J8]